MRDFKRDKISRQNARLSLANAVYENPTMPRRKILLSTGANNYRPPLERSKSAPKLMAIEEIGEEDEEEADEEQTGVNQSGDKKVLEEVRACCKEDYLYPSITLGRRRCRRGHSIRRSRLRNSLLNKQKSYPPTKIASVEDIVTPTPKDLFVQHEEKNISKSLDCDLDISTAKSKQMAPTPAQRIKSANSLGSDEDFESFLLYNNYDSKEPLAGDLMSYFDLQLQSPHSSMTSNQTTMSLLDLNDQNNSLQHNKRNTLSLDNLVDYQSDNELDEPEDDDEVFFNQESVLDTLRRQSKAINESNTMNKHFILNNKNVDIYEKTEDGYVNASEPNCSHNEYIFNRKNLNVMIGRHNEEDDLGSACASSSSSPSSLICVDDKTLNGNLDSDEGSISSGCETSSTVTTNTEEATTMAATNGDETLIPRTRSVLDRVRSFEQLAGENQVNKEPIGERVGSINTTKFFKRSITFPTPNGTGSLNRFLLTSTGSNGSSKSATLTRSGNKSIKIEHVDSDSDEFSDESGYVEFQDLSLKSVFA